MTARVEITSDHGLAEGTRPLRDGERLLVLLHTGSRQVAIYSGRDWPIAQQVRDAVAEAMRALIARIRELEDTPLAHSQAMRVAEAVHEETVFSLEAAGVRDVDLAAIVARIIGEDPAGEAERAVVEAALAFYTGPADTNGDALLVTAVEALRRAREAGR